MKTLAICLILFIASCSKNDQVEIPVNNHLDIQIRNTQGADLLNPKTNGTLNTENVKVLYKTSAGWVEAFNASLDCPKQICFYESTGNFIARLFPNDISSDVITETKIQWNDQNSDIIKCKPLRNQDGLVYSNAQVWFNDELVLPDKMIPGSSNGILIIRD